MRRINLALQGGGAHGAFSWGVVERLLEVPDLEIAAISGTSAGALNGAALKAGLVAGGAEAARVNLSWLWGLMGGISAPGLGIWFAGWPTEAVSTAIAMSPAYWAGEIMSRGVSPYGSGPLYANPLEPIARRFAYERVCAETGPDLYVCATNVRSGKIRVFRGKEIGPEAILASACLPTVFRAVEIDDPKTGRREAYWDGGYTGNPALFPFFTKTLPDDVVIVNINPLYRDEVPKTPHEIQNRVNEIGFNPSLLSELRAIAFAKRLIHEGRVEPGAMKDVRIHMIADDALMNTLSVATKMVPNPVLIERMRQAGRAAAEAFIARDLPQVGVASTVDLPGMFG